LVLGIARFVVVKEMWNYLTVKEEPKSADVIIVLTGGIDRVTYGVKLYQLGYAHKVLFAGGSARKMSIQAQTLGLPSDAVLLEVESYSTYTNAKYSLEVMRSQGFKSAIVVSSPWHTRRVSLIFHKFFRGLDLTVAGVPYDSSLSNNWWKDSNLAYDVVTEYLKLVWHYLFER